MPGRRTNIPTTVIVDNMNQLIYKNSQCTEQMCKHYCTRALYNHINYNAKLVKQKVFWLFKYYEQNPDLLGILYF